MRTKLLNWQLEIGNWQLSSALFVRFTRSSAERSSLIALAQLSARATLQRALIRTQTGASVNRKHALNFSMRPRNDVDADEFANTPCCCRAGISRCLHRTN